VPPDDADGTAVVVTRGGVGDADACTGDEVAAGALDGCAVAGAVGSGFAASLTSSRFTASCVSNWTEFPVMPWPSSETARRLPAVAVAAPSSQAATPKRMRLCTP
jgi:hypothetical protein